MYSPAVSRAFLRSVGVFIPPRRRRTNRILRAKLIVSDSCCYYCGYSLTLNDSTLDHVLPVSKGGTNRLDNLVLACYECNQEKADKIVW